MIARRGFPVSEYQARVSAAQAMMSETDISALLLTSPEDVFYFTGILPQGAPEAISLVIPKGHSPKAAFPKSCQPLMSQSWITDIHPNCNGAETLAEILSDYARGSERIGVPIASGSGAGEAPLGVNDILPRQVFGSDDEIMSQLRMIKSPAEIEKITRAYDIAHSAFARVPQAAPMGTPLSLIFRRFQTLCLDEGADAVQSLAGAGEAGGYSDVFSPSHDRPVEQGDILMLATGLVWDGYLCNVMRNWSYGEPEMPLAQVHAGLIAATDAAVALAAPGMTAADLSHCVGLDVTHCAGHGVGLSICEAPKLTLDSATVLQPGMVIKLQPTRAYRGKMLAHSETIVIADSGARWLSHAQGPDIPIIE